MTRKQRISVIDQDVVRSRAIAAELSADGNAEVLVSSPKDRAKDAFDDIDAYVIGASEQGRAAEAVLRHIESTETGARVVIVGIKGRFQSKPPPDNGMVIRSAGETAAPRKVKVLVEGLLSDQPSTTGANQRRPSHLFRSLVGDSDSIRQVQNLIDHVAVTQSTVLITGESGTGKEVVARNIHYRSNRREHPFVPVNCAAIPPDLFESELFGHEKGAFTGALSTRKGRFELADRGTLFLDEIGDMPLGTQTKLLRVIQERLFERLGSNKSLTTNVRIIAATHCDLEKRINDKRFRKDLYYRLNVFPIHMPSLSQRASDIPLLIDELRARLQNELGLNIEFANDAIECLKARHWEGNVRELANAVERLAVLFPGQSISAQELPIDLSTVHADLVPSGTVDSPSEFSPDGIDLKQRLWQMERELIDEAMRRCDGVVAKAARLLKIGRTTLTEKLRRYEIEVDHYTKPKEDGETKDGA